MLTLNPTYEHLSKFRSATPKILCGDLLDDVKKLQTSIIRTGLKTPLIVAKDKDRLVVVDGRKRLMALRRLRFDGTLPAHLQRIPYILVDQDYQRATDLQKTPPVELYNDIKSLLSRGASLSEAALKLGQPKHHIKSYLKIEALSPYLKRLFLGGALSLDQALAFATIPNLNAQDALFIQLGPLAQDADILTSIKNGETVLLLPDGDAMILPSRKPSPERLRRAA